MQVASNEESSKQIFSNQSLRERNAFTWVSGLVVNSIDEVSGEEVGGGIGLQTGASGVEPVGASGRTCSEVLSWLSWPLAARIPSCCETDALRRALQTANEMTFPPAE